MDFRKIFEELTRRNVIRAVVAYLAVAWVVVEIASTLLPVFGAPPYVLKGLIYLLAVGLVFWIGFSWVYDLTPGGFKKTDSEDLDLENQQQNSRRLNRVIAGSVIAAVLVLLGASFWAGSQWNENDRAGSFARVAVLPLEPRESGAEEYQGAGFTNAIIETLSELEDLVVLSLASTRYLEAGIAPANDLFQNEVSEIDYFLYGNYRLQDNALTMDLELSDALEEASFWQKQYRGDISEARTLWTEVAHDVSEVIGLEPVKAERLMKRIIRPVQPETYELYLKGKYYLNKSRVADWERALVYFLEAVDKNPADPYAYAGLAECYISLAHNAMTPPEGVFPKALAAAKRAIQLDSTNAEGWAALSQYHTYFGWDWEMAEFAFQKANALNPNLAYNHYHRAWYLALFERMDEAIAAHETAREIDPFSAMHTAWLGALYNMKGDYEAALREADEASQMEDDYSLSNVIRGRAYLGLGEEEKALEALQEAARVNYGYKYMFYGPVLFQLGYRDEAMEILREVEARPESPYFSLCLANLYYADGNIDKTFYWLERAKGHGWYPWYVRLFLASPEISEDARYAPMLDELNLPPAQADSAVNF